MHLIITMIMMMMIIIIYTQESTNQLHWLSFETGPPCWTQQSLGGKKH